MNEQPDNEIRDERWSQALAACLEAAENGQEVDRERLFSCYPEFAAELAAFLDHRDQVARWLAPLRARAAGNRLG
jgi:hypothetical protein